MQKHKPEEEVPLFDEFEHVTSDQWRTLVEAELDGADFEKKLVSKTADGRTVPPLSIADDLSTISHLDTIPGEAPYLRGTSRYGQAVGGWAVRSSLTTGDEVTAACSALEQDDLHPAEYEFLFSEQNHPGTPAELAEILDPFVSSGAGIVLDAGIMTPVFGALAFEALHQRGLDASRFSGVLKLDPCSSLLSEKTRRISIERSFDALASTVVGMNDALPGFRSFVVSGSIYHNAGAGPVLEIAATLGGALQCLRECEARGVDPQLVAQSVQFSFPVGSMLLEEVAKLRAVRMLWAKIVKHTVGQIHNAFAMNLHVESSSREMTMYDRHVNILRATLAAMAGAIAGANSISVRPFDEVIGERTGLARRIARNTNLLLMHESHLHGVVDPAGGSYSIEKRTEELARAAWLEFQQLEADGGWLSVVRSGALQRRIVLAHATSVAAVASRRTVLVGTNQYPNLGETCVPPQQPQSEKRPHSEPLPSEISSALRTSAKKAGRSFIRDVAAVFNTGATALQVVHCMYPEEASSPIEVHLRHERIAKDIEDIRLRVESAGRKPRVYLLLYGPPVWRSARATFSAGFLGVAGFQITEGPGCDSVEEALENAMPLNADIVVACSEDAAYSQTVPTIIDTVRRTGVSPVFLVAGNPKADVEKLEQAGVNGFIHVRADLLHELNALLSALDITDRDGGSNEN
ncbi:MAG: hypothetical protein HY962_04535 [Ignavibacteriae bacterium]|nr:hypothetical protein [Ignavibacteriota bacterium]